MAQPITSKYRNYSFSAELPPAMADMRDRGELTDVIFTVSNGQETLNVAAHRVVLASVSPYFKVLFLGSFQEAKQNIVNIEDTDPKIFDTFIKMIYGRGIHFRDGKTLLGVLLLAQFFRLGHVDIVATINEVVFFQEDIPTYVQTVKLLRPGGELTDVDIGAIVYAIKTDADLSDLTSKEIQQVLTHRSYKPENEMITYNIVDRLVKMGRGAQLYELVDFNIFTPEQLDSIPSQIVERFASSSRHRNLDKFFELNKNNPNPPPFTALYFNLSPDPNLTDFGLTEIPNPHTFTSVSGSLPLQSRDIIRVTQYSTESDQYGISSITVEEWEKVGEISPQDVGAVKEALQYVRPY